MNGEYLLIALLPFLIVVAGIALIALYCYAATEFYKIAKLKGYNNRLYLVLLLIIPIAGYLLVIALPDKNVRTQNGTPTQTNYQVSNDLPEI